MRYKEFKLRLSTAIELVKRGLNEKAIRNYLSIHGFNLNDEIMRDFMSKAKEIPQDPKWLPDPNIKEYLQAEYDNLQMKEYF